MAKKAQTGDADLTAVLKNDERVISLARLLRRVVGHKHPCLSPLEGLIRWYEETGAVDKNANPPPSIGLELEAINLSDDFTAIVRDIYGRFVGKSKSNRNFAKLIAQVSSNCAEFREVLKKISKPGYAPDVERERRGKRKEQPGGTETHQVCSEETAAFPALRESEALEHARARRKEKHAEVQKADQEYFSMLVWGKSDMPKVVHFKKWLKQMSTVEGLSDELRIDVAKAINYFKQKFAVDIKYEGSSCNLDCTPAGTDGLFFRLRFPSSKNAKSAKAKIAKKLPLLEISP